MFKSSAAAVALILLCGGAHAEWVKEGATADDLRREQSECDRQARADAAFRAPPMGRGAGQIGGGRSANNMVRENQSFQLCMKSKGYVDSSGK